VFQGFYDRCAAGQEPGYPRFKPRSRFDQVMFVAGDGAKWSPAGGGGWAQASFQAVGAVKVRQHRPVRGTVKTLQLKREHRRWYVIVVAGTEPVPRPATERKIGVDMGVARFLTTSDGEIIPNPEYLADVSAARNVYARAGLGSGQAAPAA
jgi:putative transposase